MIQLMKPQATGGKNVVQNYKNSKEDSLNEKAETGKRKENWKNKKKRKKKRKKETEKLLELKK